MGEVSPVDHVGEPLPHLNTALRRVRGTSTVAPVTTPVSPCAAGTVEEDAEPAAVPGIRAQSKVGVSIVGSKASLRLWPIGDV